MANICRAAFQQERGPQEGAGYANPATPLAKKAERWVWVAGLSAECGLAGGKSEPPLAPRRPAEPPKPADHPSAVAEPRTMAAEPHRVEVGRGLEPTVQPLRVVRPDAVCEVGGSTPDLSYGDLGISPGGGHPEKLVH